MLGFVSGATTIRRPIRDEDDRIYLVRELIDLGALFSAGDGWSPAEIVELHASKGLANGPYKRIAWKNQGEYAILVEKCNNDA